MIVIRIALLRDEESVSRLLLKTFSHLYATMGVKMTLEREAYLSAQADRRPYSKTFLYEDCGKVLGTLTLVPPCSQSQVWIRDAWELRLLAVDPCAQKRGIARDLLTYAEQYAIDAGAAAMCLHARRGISNQARLYLGIGYTRNTVGDIDENPYLEAYQKYLKPTV